MSSTSTFGSSMVLLLGNQTRTWTSQRPLAERSPRTIHGVEASLQENKTPEEESDTLM